jgi:hypothetical protein
LVVRLSKFPNIRISCLKRIRDVAVEWNATHVVSLLDPDIQVEDIPKFREGVEHQCLFFYDEDDPPEGSDLLGHPESVLTYLHAGPLRDQSSRLIIHCHGGASRSPALCALASSFRVLGVFVTGMLRPRCSQRPSSAVVSWSRDGLLSRFAMSLRRAAALAPVGWYLMIPDRVRLI